MVIPLGWNTWDLAVLLQKVLPGLEGWENPSFRAAQVYLSLDPPLHWIVRLHLGLRAAVSRGFVTTQPPHATLKRVHPSCLAVVCLCCPSFPAAGSSVTLASAALPCFPVPGSGTAFFLPRPAEPWPPRLHKSSRGRRQSGVSEARAHTSFSLCGQQSWGHLPALGHGDPSVGLKRLWCSYSQGKAGI